MENLRISIYFENLIIGRVEPHIYAFQTNKIADYLKIGDTYRPLNKRLKESATKMIPDLIKIYSAKATVDQNVYFRD